jgi:hypothetical protein
MAEANPKVMEMISGELKKNPDVSNKELFEKAKSMDKAIAKLSPRQFNARYPLQVKRTMAPRKPAAAKGARRGRGRKAAAGAAATGGAAAPSSTSPVRGRKGAAAADPRHKVRGVLLELARDVANAQGKGDVVDVIMGIDRYVDRVVKAAG